MGRRGSDRAARVRLAIGLLLYEIEKYDCAAEVLRASLSYAPDLVAAHVWLGFIYGQEFRYEEMIGEFRQAIKLDPKAARAAVGAESEEMRKIWQAFEEPQEMPEDGAEEEEWGSAIPVELKEAWGLADEAMEHIAAGRDAKAVMALERSIEMDEVFRYAIIMLGFVYLLNRRMREEWAGRTVLWRAARSLARRIFGS